MTSELHQQKWAVVTDKEVIATGLVYEMARQVRNAHSKKTKNGGTCVVTDETAARLKGKKENGD